MATRARHGGNNDDNSPRGVGTWRGGHFGWGKQSQSVHTAPPAACAEHPTDLTLKK